MSKENGFVTISIPFNIEAIASACKTDKKLLEKALDEGRGYGALVIFSTALCEELNKMSSDLCHDISCSSDEETIFILRKSESRKEYLGVDVLEVCGRGSPQLERKDSILVDTSGIINTGLVKFYIPEIWKQDE